MLGGENAPILAPHPELRQEQEALLFHSGVQVFSELFQRSITNVQEISRPPQHLLTAVAKYLRGSRITI